MLPVHPAMTNALIHINIAAMRQFLSGVQL